MINVGQHVFSQSNQTYSSSNKAPYLMRNYRNDTGLTQNCDYWRVQVARDLVHTLDYCFICERMNKLPASTCTHSCIPSHPWPAIASVVTMMHGVASGWIVRQAGMGAQL